MPSSEDTARITAQGDQYQAALKARAVGYRAFYDELRESMSEEQAFDLTQTFLVESMAGEDDD